MSVQYELQEIYRKGRKLRCAVTGMYFHEHEMILDSFGRLVYEKCDRRDLSVSKVELGPGWTREP